MIVSFIAGSSTRLRPLRGESAAEQPRRRHHRRSTEALEGRRQVGGGVGRGSVRVMEGSLAGREGKRGEGETDPFRDACWASTPPVAEKYIVD